MVKKEDAFMRVTFLGTGAATACPLVFCRCPVCRAGWERGGKDLRRRSSALIGEDTLIDLGPDIMSAAFAFGVDIGQVRYCLQTHAHSDHFDAGHLITRMADYATADPLPLTVFKKTGSDGFSSIFSLRCRI